METQNEMRLTLFFFYFFLSVVSTTPILDCFLDNQECQVDADNLVSSYMGIKTMEECTILCQDDTDCTAFTHYGQESLPFSWACLLFRSCSQRKPCLDCVTGSSQTECTCSIRFSGSVNANNFVDLIGTIIDESECKEYCSRNAMCHVYTYYDSLDPLKPNVCILLTSVGLQNPVTSCEHCATGPARCEVGRKCQVSVVTNGTAVQTIFAERDTLLTFIATEKECYTDLYALAIGGGGYGYVLGGGGSGHIKTETLRLTANGHAVVEIRIGGPGKASRLEIRGEVILNAAAGEKGSTKGGDGYSGGGGVNGNGGTDGCDGEDGDGLGGHGSGLDIGNITMVNFDFAPGEGGSGKYGGGGGGLLVDGKSPGNISPNGNGYGGGGGSTEYNPEDGYSGCVLIEL